MCNRGEFTTLTGDGLLGILGVAVGGGLALLAVAHTLEWHKQYMKASKRGKKAPEHGMAMQIPKFNMKPHKGGLCKECFSFKLPKYYVNAGGAKVKW